MTAKTPRSRKTVRSAPKSPYDDAPKGHCRMCGEAILAKAGKLSLNRRWCDEHQIEARIRQHAVYARAAVFLRDRGICRDCGTDCTNYQAFERDHHQLDPESWAYVRGYRVQINRERALDWCRRLLDKKQNPRNRQSIECIDLGEWEADHVYPLWLVDRDEPDAWKYWTLDNLVTRCPRCHQGKTNKEAGQRAKVNRLNGTTKKKRRGPKIAQRANPWPKGRKLQSRNDLRRS